MAIHCSVIVYIILYVRIGNDPECHDILQVLYINHDESDQINTIIHEPERQMLHHLALCPYPKHC